MLDDSTISLIFINSSCYELCLSYNQCVYYANVSKSDSVLGLNEGTCILKSFVNIENGHTLPDYYQSTSLLSKNYYFVS
jgi:hypothetical protein